MSYQGLHGAGFFNSARQAFEHLYEVILDNGEVIAGTKALYNVGFYLMNPLDNLVLTPWRRWNVKYAQQEFEWYLNGNPSVHELKKVAKIWDRMHPGNDLVQSNYGWQWGRNGQLEKVIQLLKEDSTTRRASISIYDGKEIDNYKLDTPCTYGIHFYVRHGQLCMTVLMRSNDLVYGFCNDQYCFSRLQALVAKRLELPVGPYYHFAANLHIYEKHYDLKLKFNHHEQ